MKNRQTQRQQIDLVARLQTDDDTVDILITDISLGGVQLQLRKGSRPLPVQGEVILNVPLFNNIRAVVVWNSDDTHGIKFLECPPSLVRFMDSISNFSQFNETVRYVPA